MISNLTNTTASEVDKALVNLRETGGAIALGRVLTLVIVTSSREMEEPIEAAIQASHEHPCRVLVLVLDPDADEDGLDAEIRVGRDAGAGEVVILHAKGQVTSSVDTLVMPLLLPDAPIVTWWPTNPPSAPAQDLIGHLSQRRITDVQRCENPAEVMKRLRRGYQPGDSDLTWTRLTNWRGLIASAFDVPPRQEALAVELTGVPHNPSVILMKHWLELTLGKEVTVYDTDPDYPGLREVRIKRADGEIVVTRLSSTRVGLKLPGMEKDQVRSMPLRTLFECLSEELRRLDPDEVYGAVMANAFGTISEAVEYALNKPVPRDVVVADADELVAQAASSVIAKVKDALAEREQAHVVLTGGSIGTRVANALPAVAKENEVDLSAVHLWWGDERFVPAGDIDRNDAGVKELLTAEGIRPEHIHRMPSSDQGMSPQDAAAWYAQQLALWGGDAQFRTRGVPFFDVVMLGVGPDAHVASLFPEHKDGAECSHPVIPVYNSPKPPATRLSLSFPVLNSARSVMLLVSGEGKADAVVAGHGEPCASKAPDSSVRGTEETVWFMDQAAASKLNEKISEE